ncbi:MAG: serine hydrolase [Pseudomonadales bacterium]|nr:serine hydrolase [Pseudomonadales bacterium]MCP5203730.1 serine hydrolase [Pseudomonadales bacterium]
MQQSTNHRRSNRRRLAAVTGSILAAALSLPGGAAAASPDSAPVTAASLGLMQGFPPPADKRVTRDNFMEYPYSRWAFQHIRELQPTRDIFRGEGSVAPLAPRPVDLDTLKFDVPGDRQLDLKTWLAESVTDAFLVLHRGELVYERYFNGMARTSQHQMFSATKSFVGMLVLCLIEEGAIDPGKTLQDYIPELKGSGFGDATVQQVLNMTTSLAFNEDYTDPEADVWKYGYVFGIATPPAGYTGASSIYEFLPALGPAERAHGEAFLYATPNTDVLGWLSSRVTGKSVSRQLQERVWQQLGVERDGYMWLNELGEEMAGGGLNITAADAARFGQMILHKGQYNGRQILPEAVARRILQAGNPEPFNRYYNDIWYEQIGYAYHDQWWTFNNPHKAVSAIGVHGQFIYIDPVAEMVIVKQSSHPEAESMANEVDGPLIWQAIAEHLMGQP